MHKSIRIIPALILASSLSPSLAGADALCNYDDTVKMDGYLKRGKEAEKAGKTRDALLYFMAIDPFCGPGDEARKHIKAIGLKYGARAAERGRILSDGGIFKNVQDENCRRWMRYMHIDSNPYETAIPGHCSTASRGTRVEIDQQAGAFDWFEATFNYREADLALLKLMAKSTGDIEVFDHVYQHFEAHKKVNPSGYEPDRAMFTEIEKSALAGLEMTLAKEDREFAATKLAQRSLQTLGKANRWASYLNDEARWRVAARAIDRGENALEAGTPEGLSDALAYFDFAGSDELRSTVVKQADALGRAALDKKDYSLAERYFLVAGNIDMAETARRLAKEKERTPAEDQWR